MNAVIVLKLVVLYPEMQILRERLDGVRVFQYWGYCNMLYTIETGSMRRIQWYKEYCDSTKTLGSSPRNVNGGGIARWGMRFSIFRLL
jgi:hypothetical protein